MPEEWEPQGSDVDLPQEPEAVYFSRALGLLARPRHRKSALHLHNHHHASERAGAATPRSDAHDLRPPMGRQWLERPFGSRGGSRFGASGLPSERMEAHEFRRWSTTGERLGGCIQPVSPGQLRKSQLSLLMRL